MKTKEIKKQEIKCNKKECIHKWGELEREYETSWMLNDDTVKFYYQRCEKCGIIRIL
jgi:hypothetical protein